MKVKMFSLDTVTNGGKVVDYKFPISVKEEKSNVLSKIKEMMSRLGRPYSIYVSPKEFENDDIKSFDEIEEFLKKSLE